MRPLELDYSGRRSWVTLEAVAWFGVGLLVLAVSITQYGEVMEALERQESRLDSLRAQLDRAAKAKERRVAEAKAREPELKEAKAVLRRLAMPWEGVFGALEQATRVHRDRIRVLGVQPDVEKGLVLLTGEAKDFGELMDYLDRIGNSGMLRRVRLVNHQVQTDVAGRPIRFYAVAEWKTEL